MHERTDCGREDTEMFRVKLRAFSGEACPRTLEPGADTGSPLRKYDRSSR